MYVKYINAITLEFMVNMYIALIYSALMFFYV